MTEREHTAWTDTIDAEGKRLRTTHTYPTWTRAYQVHIAEAICMQVAATQLALDPEERRSINGLANYACDLAESLVKEFKRREWIATLPPPHVVETAHIHEDLPAM